MPRPSTAYALTRGVGERQFDSKVGPSSGSKSKPMPTQPQPKIKASTKLLLCDGIAASWKAMKRRTGDEQHGQEKFEDDASGDASLDGPFQTYPEDALLMEKPLNYECTQLLI